MIKNLIKINLKNKIKKYQYINLNNKKKKKIIIIIMSIGVPVKLLHESEHHIVTIELKTGD